MDRETLNRIFNFTDGKHDIFVFYIILMEHIETLNLSDHERRRIVEILDGVVLKFWNEEQKTVSRLH